MFDVSLKHLLEAGVHFGHQTRRWNPKMKRFIFAERNGIYIIDLQKTIQKLEEAYVFARDDARRGGRALFVGTKKQAQAPVVEEASRAGAFYVIGRWLGGTLTNFETIRKNIDRLKRLEAMEADGTLAKYTKKEQLSLTRERDRLIKLYAGIKEMNRLPTLVFVIDPRREAIAVKEANRLGIPVVGLVDTNCDPDPITHVIPGNDDAIRSIRLMAATVANAIAEGRGAATEGAAPAAEQVIAVDAPGPGAYVSTD
jgi:small subunit ribosomal protein S2